MKRAYDYPVFPDMRKQLEPLVQYGKLKYEQGSDASSIQAILNEANDCLLAKIDEIMGLPEDPGLLAREPDDLAAIRALRPQGRRAIWQRFDREKYREKIRGALLGRFAGCTLGAPVEFWTTDAMEKWAAHTGDDFPPGDYWSRVKTPDELRYGVSTFLEYTRGEMTSVPVDDDTTYTVLGLLIMEDHGPGFTTEDVGRAWLKYLPHGCTAEAVALDNLRKGIPAELAGSIGNPYVQWIGAAIRSDPWGYMAPGRMEKAAEFAFRDAFISHRRNGIYDAMFFSAAIAAAFEVKDTVEALEQGLAEIPGDCLLAGDIRWALDKGRGIKDYREARQAVEDRFKGMGGAHANLNACLTVFGLMIGKDDFSKVIGETVAMGYDNDCTAATAGSIAGAVLGAGNIPAHWTRPFQDRMLTYLHGHPACGIDDLAERFSAQAEKILGQEEGT
ncbi:MAG: ADP-ribosylglycohydrolase family protein [Clostridia bacterium]